VERVETVSVLVVALRRREVQTEALLVRPAGNTACGRWDAARGGLAEGESEARAAIRVLGEQTGLAANRLYASGLALENRDPARGRAGRIGVFVAFVGPGAEGPPDTASRWLPLTAASELDADDGLGPLLAAVRERFVRTPPDEALRVA